MYSLEFHPLALKEWQKLDNTIREQFKDKLTERLQNPCVPSAKIGKNRYKIKLRNAGYRLVYEVRDNELIIVVVAVGKREQNTAYRLADNRKP
ncbi:MAG: type II toxin-antitoxin system RelE/ParE family toxin [Methylovulum sp.]|nr:type II toxin-antitoxin system RelE/ParE family toxin [Methylovulum sp.]